MQSISVQKLAERLANSSDNPPILLDVREASELQICTINHSQHIRLSDLPERCIELNKNADIICICHHGMRSAKAAALLLSQGYSRVFNLEGGIDAWAAIIDPKMARY